MSVKIYRKRRFARGHTIQGQLRPRVLAVLGVSDQPQSDAEPKLGEESSVFRIRDAPNFPKNPRVKSRLFKKLDGKLSCYDAEVVAVGSLKELSEYLLFLGSEYNIDGARCYAGTVKRSAWSKCKRGYSPKGLAT